MRGSTTKIKCSIYAILSSGMRWGPGASKERRALLEGIKIRCLVIRYLLRDTDWVTQIRFISGKDSCSGKDPNLDFSRLLTGGKSFS